MGKFNQNQRDLNNLEQAKRDLINGICNFVQDSIKGGEKKWWIYLGEARIIKSH